MAKAPERLGKYYILGLIAQGGMAEVYKAKTVGIAGFEKVLALKRIRPKYVTEARFIRNFTDEARIAVTLNHRNIVQVFDFGKADGELYLAMELLDGVDLRTAMQALGSSSRIPAALSCYLLSEVAFGLDYAHRKTDADGVPLGIVHCDVSPHNVLLSREGFVKILDFGVARARFIAAPTSRRLRGKPRYMAPEQSLGETPTFASDVFVLGILAWELLSGRKLFRGPSLQAILRAVREAPILDIATIRPDLPAPLCMAVMRALHRSPIERGNSRDIAEALAQAGRDLANGSNAQALSSWLSKHCADPEHEPETATEIVAATSASALEQQANESLHPETVRNIKPMSFPALTLEPSRFSSPAEVTEQGQTGFDPAPLERTQLSIHIATSESGESDLDSGDQGSSIENPTASLESLMDKRRVVIAVLRLDGGTELRRLELSRAVSDLAYKRGAIVHQQSEQEVVALFGLEFAGEDDIASSMQYAVDAAELAHNVTADGTPIKMRSAARSGVVAQRRGDTYQLRGEALSEARELARSAEPFRPLLSGGASRVASAQFRFRELAARRYHSRRLRVLELTGPSNHDDRRKALRDRRGIFVGRVSESELLWSEYQESVYQKSPRGVIIEGASGIGKSRLIAEFVGRLDNQPEEVLLITTAATSQASEAPLTMVVEHMQAALQLSPGHGERARASLARALATCMRGVVEEELIEDACESFELAMELRDGSLGVTEVAAATLRERCARSIATVHQALADRGTSLVVLENFHLADRASIEVVRHLLCGDTSPFPCLFVISTRHDPYIRERLSCAEVIELHELSSEDSSTLIRDRLADTTAEISVVAHRAGGNPLYIEELCRTIRDVGWDATPATVRDTVAAQIDRLSKRSRAVLQRAAVIGQVFRSSILEELIGTEAAPFLQELVEEGLLIQEHRSDAQTVGGEFSFRHGLIHEVVYSSLSAGARRSTHANLGKLLALRSESGLDEPPAVIADHLERGGELLSSATHWYRAGRVAQAAFETTSACEAYSCAIHLVNQLGKHAKLRARSLHREALFGRARAYKDLGEDQNQRSDLHDLESLCVPNSENQAQLFLSVAERLLRSASFDQAIQITKKAEQIAVALQLPLLRGEALRLSGEALERLGDYAQGQAQTEAALRLFDSHAAQSLATRARISLARNFLVQSRYADAKKIYEPVLDEMHRNADPGLERIASNHLAVIHLCLGEFEDAMRCAQRSRLLCEADNDHARTGDNLSVCGIILNEVGQYEEAAGYFTRALTLHQETNSRWSEADSLIYAGTNAMMLGDFKLGIERLTMAHEYATEIKSPYVAVNAGNGLAEALLLRNAPGDIENALEHARASSAKAVIAKLPGAEALAYSRQAQATQKLGNTLEAYEISLRAMEILDRQQFLEGSEEEVVYTHYTLAHSRSLPESPALLQRCIDGFSRKLELIENAAWRHSFSSRVPLHALLSDISSQIQI